MSGLCLLSSPTSMILPCMSPRTPDQAFREEHLLRGLSDSRGVFGRLVSWMTLSSPHSFVVSPVVMVSSIDLSHG